LVDRLGFGMNVKARGKQVIMTVLFK